MRYQFLVFWMFFASATSAIAQVSVGIGIGLPGLSIGINLPAYPEMVPVPGYPVYYAPRLSSNFFFYDGMYWVYQGDNWYASSWYNGPWGMMGPESVPLFVLRIPVRYYRSPPPYFYGWQPDGPPRWGEHWGRGWEQQRSGWDRWNRSSAPAPAPLPVYQRQYSGDRYPQHQQQQQIHNQNYRYQPRDDDVRQRYQEESRQRGPAPSTRGQPGASQERYPVHQEGQRASPQQPIQQSPRAQPAQRGGEELQKSAPPPVATRRAGRARSETAAPAGRRSTRAAGTSVKPGKRAERQGCIPGEQARTRSGKGPRQGRRTRTGSAVRQGDWPAHDV